MRTLGEHGFSPRGHAGTQGAGVQDLRSHVHLGSTGSGPDWSPTATWGSWACLFGDVCYRKPLFTHGQTPSTQTPRVPPPHTHTKSSVSLLDGQQFPIFTTPGTPEAPRKQLAKPRHSPRSPGTRGGRTRGGSEVSPARLPEGVSAGPEVSMAPPLLRTSLLTPTVHPGSSSGVTYGSHSAQK